MVIKAKYSKFIRKKPIIVLPHIFVLFFHLIFLSFLTISMYIWGRRWRNSRFGIATAVICISWHFCFYGRMPLLSPTLSSKGKLGHLSFTWRWERLAKDTASKLASLFFTTSLLYVELSAGSCEYHFFTSLWV